jgi:hypothetical protein
VFFENECDLLRPLLRLLLEETVDARLGGRLLPRPATGGCDLLALRFAQHLQLADWDFRIVDDAFEQAQELPRQ